MKYYLEYLEKLQGKMNLDEKVNHAELAEYKELHSKYDTISSLFVLIGIVFALSTILVLPYSRIGVVIAMLLSIGSVCGVADNGNKAEHYGELFRNERDKVYNANYSVIKNTIIEDGDEQMQQLVTWERMCELTADDKEKYSELLRIVHDVCREYVILWGN